MTSLNRTSLASETRHPHDARPCGMIAGTKVAGALGWRPVEMIAVGDRLSTFDGGMQVVSHVTSSKLWSGTGPCPKAQWPLEIPVGALGNSEAQLLMPEQIVMFESDVAEEITGDAYVLVPAASLDGYRGIRRVEPCADLRVSTVHFESDQVVFSNTGAMYFAPAAAAATVTETSYKPMSHKIAAQFIACLTEIEASVKGKTFAPAPAIYAAAV